MGIPEIITGTAVYNVTIAFFCHRMLPGFAPGDFSLGTPRLSFSFETETYCVISQKSSKSWSSEHDTLLTVSGCCALVP